MTQATASHQAARLKAAAKQFADLAKGVSALLTPNEEEEINMRDLRFALECALDDWARLEKAAPVILADLKLWTSLE